MALGTIYHQIPPRPPTSRNSVKILSATTSIHPALFQGCNSRGSQTNTEAVYKMCNRLHKQATFLMFLYSLPHSPPKVIISQYHTQIETHLTFIFLNLTVGCMCVSVCYACVLITVCPMSCSRCETKRPWRGF